MTKKERLVEAIVAMVFGFAILFVGIFSTKDVATIVLGGLLAAIGIGCAIWAYLDTDTVESSCCCETKKIVEETPHKEVYKEPTKKSTTTKKTTSTKTATKTTTKK